MKIQASYKLLDGGYTVFEEESLGTPGGIATYHLTTRKSNKRITSYLGVCSVFKVVCVHHATKQMAWAQHDHEVKEFLRTRGEGCFSRAPEILIRRPDLTPAEKKCLRRLIKWEITR